MSDPTGKVFEKDVRHLLQLQGWRVDDEKIINGKKVDGYAEYIRIYGKPERHIIECKDWEAKLTRANVTSIVADYLGFIQSKAIDVVLIVTRNGIAPSAESYIDSVHGIEHIKYVELLNRLMDFSLYMQGLLFNFESISISDYYQQSRFSTNVLELEDCICAEEAIIKWIESDNYRPLAILASYGLGKTTLAKRLAYTLVKKHMENPINRIPILIPLEGISTESSITGLIATHLAGEGGVPSYNFNIFKSLLMKGRFVLILDGFDEMQQAMSRKVMRQKFRQIRTLAEGNSKMIILGRENVFLDKEEREQLLLDKVNHKSIVKPRESNAGYGIIELESFTTEQVNEFIEKYSNYYATYMQNQEYVESGKVLIKELAGEAGSRLMEIVVRPVQLKMMIEIFPSIDDLSNVTKTDLYEHFIQEIITREMDKHTRQLFDIDVRRQFAVDLACWLWSNGGRAGVVIESIPNSLFMPYMSKDADIEEVRRDLLAACFVEHKDEIVYFPHRSFMEYMIAKRILCDIDNDRVFNKLLENINSQIIEFISSIITDKQVNEFRKQFNKYRGSLDEWIIAMYASILIEVGILANEIDNDNGESPWPSVLLMYTTSRGLYQLDKEKRKALIEKHILSVPRKSKHARNIAALKISLICQNHGDIIHMYGIEYVRDIIIAMSKVAETYTWVINSESKTAKHLILKHFDRSYCAIDTWMTEMQSKNDENRVIFIRKGKKKVQKEKARNKREKKKVVRKREETAKRQLQR